MSHQPTKDLQQFQKLIVQDLYIKYLNKGLDYLGWENEKKDAIIEMKDNEINELKNSMSIQTLQFTKLQREFKEYINKVKKAKVDLEKEGKQQELISELRNKLRSAEERLKVSHQMNQLLVKQKH